MPSSSTRIRAAIVLVVLQDALLELWGSVRTPSVEPFNRAGAGRVLITPYEPQILSQSLDRTISDGPFGRLQDHVSVQINSARGPEQSLDVFGRADVGMFLLELAVSSALVLRVVVDSRIGARREIIKSRSKGAATVFPDRPHPKQAISLKWRQMMRTLQRTGGWS